MALAATEIDAERNDLLAILAQHRQFLRHTTRELTDEQARARTTVSELTLGGLIKHVTPSNGAGPRSSSRGRPRSATRRR